MRRMIDNGVMRMMKGMAVIEIKMTGQGKKRRRQRPIHDVVGEKRRSINKHPKESSA